MEYLGVAHRRTDQPHAAVSLTRSTRTGLSGFGSFWVVRYLLVAAMAIASVGCGGRIDDNPDPRLGVPFRAADFSVCAFPCGPASVLMWRLYDGRPGISQASIANYMGGCNSGVSPADIVDAVRYMTDSGFDAFYDVDGDVEPYQSEFMSRQITSIDRSTPVIAILDGLHAVVVNGGKWRSLTGGKYQWDYVFYHDSYLSGGNRQVSAGEWTSRNCAGACAQVVSSAATVGSYLNWLTYGGILKVRGRYDWPPRGEWPPEY